MGLRRARPLLVNISPLPNRRNGIADYAATLLERLSEHYRCLCVVDEVETVDPGIRRFAEVLSHAEYAAIAPGLRGERHLYHIGNNPDSVFALSYLAQTPGTLVLHDPTIHFLIECWADRYFGTTSVKYDIAQIFHGPLAAEAVILSDGELMGKRKMHFPFFEVDFLPLLNELARSMIVHSACGQVAARAGGYEGSLHLIPHFAKIPKAQIRTRQRQIWRNRLHLSEDTLLFYSPGFATRYKQIPKVLEALAMLPKSVENWLYVIAGENRDPEIGRVIRRHNLQNQVVVMDYLDAQAFDGLVAAADLLINLRFPTSGETSGSVCRALGYGLPCVVSNHGWFSELPAETCFRIPPAADIVSDLRQVLLRVLLDPAQLRAKATAARTYAETFLALDHVVPAYCAAIEAAHGGQPTDDAGAITGRRSEMLLQPQVPVLLQPSDRETALRRLLTAECVTVNGIPTRRSVLPGSCEVPLAMTGKGGPVEQLFAVLEQDEPFLGRLFAVLGAARDRLATGDLLSVALLCDQPDGDGPGLHGMTLPGILDAALECYGFAPIRAQDRQIISETADDPYCRIVLATARKVTDRPPAPGLFLSALGPSTFPSSAVSDKGSSTS